MEHLLEIESIEMQRYLNLYCNSSSLPFNFIIQDHPGKDLLHIEITTLSIYLKMKCNNR